MPSSKSPLDDTDPAVADTQASDPGAPTTPAAASAVTTARAPRQVRAGDVLGRYELGEDIGEGGMATVFRARDRELRRDVAVKVLFPHLAKRGEVVRRFHREARAAAGLEHPNILRIYDVGGGTDDDPPYIVMELIRGRTLLQEVEQNGAVLAEVTACIGALLADALGAAHAAGIVHRDIKPSNVLIAPGGRLLLADFGVARLETEDSLVTRTGALLGTPAYMSPEQAAGETATARSDLYSLGATLYQLATGVLPYSGSPAKVMSLIASGSFVSPARRSAAVGPDLSRVIERLMATDASARPERALDVAAELRQLAAPLGDPTEELAAFFEDPKAFLAARTPAVVATLVGEGKRAIADAKLPRAIGLADRASALAPEDPAVKTLVDAVTNRGEAVARRRQITLALGGLVLLGGVAVAAIALSSGGGATAIDAPMVVVAPPDASLDAQAPIDAELVAVVDPPAPLDAGADAPKRIALADARVPVDAEIAVVLPDAAIAISIDASVVEPGTLVVQNDTWCEIAIDGTVVAKLTSAGRTKPIEVAPGPHEVTCTQPSTGLKWKQTVTILAGKPRAIGNKLLGTVEVTIAIAADRVQIDNTHYTRGQVARLAPRRYRVVTFKDGQPQAGVYVDIPNAACRLHEAGSGLVCDP